MTRVAGCLIRRPFSEPKPGLAHTKRGCPPPVPKKIAFSKDCGFGG